MLLPRACPMCGLGDLLVEQSSAICQRCGYTGEADAVRRLMTLRALQQARERERKPSP